MTLAKRLSHIRAVIEESLNSPASALWRSVIVVLLSLIYLSVVLLVVEVRYPAIARKYADLMYIANVLVLSVFSVEFVARLAFSEKTKSYLFSAMGMIDFIAIVPGIVSLFVPMTPNLTWLRVFRIVRFARLLKLVRTSKTSAHVLGGVSGKVLPWMAIGIGTKGVLVSIEGENWWPGFGELSIVIAVSGFVLGMLLGMKLNMCMRRLYEIEDTISRIVGSLRDMVSSRPVVQQVAFEWAVALYAALRQREQAAYWITKRKTEIFEQALENENIEGPSPSNFHRDVEFLLHRVASKMPLAYDEFLKSSLFAYVAVVIIALPGLTGFFASALVIYVLGGAYYLIEDMDRPMDRDEASLMSADLSALEDWLAMNTLPQASAKDDQIAAARSAT